MKFYKVIWNEYEYDGTPVPTVLLYAKEGMRLSIYDPVEDFWCPTGYFTIHDVERVCHCVEAIQINKQEASTLLKKIKMAGELVK